MSRSRTQRDKSMSEWHAKTADGHMVRASIGNDFSNGHRCMARAVPGANRYVRGRVRARNKAALQRSNYDQD